MIAYDGWDREYQENRSHILIYLKDLCPNKL